MPGKKKGKGKKTKKQENRTDVITEVDKTFYELQITDLNRKLARLKQSSQELETTNQQLENKLSNLDEDRADVISYLKRTVTTKQEESLELQERVTALQETKESEGKEFEDRIEELELENKTMKEQLTSEIKLLTGKLNALEEFRMQRDDLMEKFQQQENTIQEQEKKEKKALYDIEKKFIISKKNITSEMEKQLYKLANDFEKANEVRIAATTQRCIRENIALNNELNKMVSTLDNLNQQVDYYKKKNTELKLNCDLYQAERNKTINELQVVRGHLDQTTKEFQSRVKILRTYEGDMKRRQKDYDDMKHAMDRENALAAKVRILEQNLHATRCKEIDLKNLVLQQTKMVQYFQEVNHEAVIAIEDCLKISLLPRLDEAGKQYRRELLLQNLLTILTQPKIQTHKILSMESIKSIDSKYKRGDLGFLPKEVVDAKQQQFRQVLNAAVQVTPRYEDGATHMSCYSPMPSCQASFISRRSEKSIMSLDSTVFQACSLFDVDSVSTGKNRTIFSSVILPGEFISEVEDDNILSTSPDVDPFGKSTSTIVTVETSGTISRQEGIEIKTDGEASSDALESVEKEADVKEYDEPLKEAVEEDIENTVFGSDESGNGSPDD